MTIWNWPPTTPPAPATAIEESGGTELSFGAIADGQLLRRVGSTIVGVDASLFTSPSEKWSLPTAPHADNVEFSSAADLAAFTLYDSAGAVVAGQPQNATVDVYSDDTVNHHIQSGTDRPSWMRWKTRRNNARFYYLRDHAPTTNELISTRCAVRTETIGGLANDEQDFGIVIMGEAAGLPDPLNRVEIFIVQIAANGRSLRARSVLAGVSTDIYTPAASFVGNEMQAAPLYLHIAKLADTFTFWCGYEGGGSSWLGISGAAFPTNATAFLYAGFVAISNGVGPGNGYGEADFLRYQNTATFVP